MAISINQTVRKCCLSIVAAWTILVFMSQVRNVKMKTPDISESEALLARKRIEKAAHRAIRVGADISLDDVITLYRTWKLD